MVNGRRRDRAPFCVAGAALGAAAAAFAWQVQHLESLGAACGQRSPPGPRTFLRGRCSTRCSGCCFCVAGAALREPGCCLWSAVAAGTAHLFAWQVQHSVHRMLLLRGRCNSSCTTHLTPFISHNSPHRTHSPYVTQLNSHNSSHTNFSHTNSSYTTHLTQLISHNLSHSIQLPQLISHNLTHTHTLISHNFTHTLIQLISRNLTDTNSSHIPHLIQLIPHKSSHTTHLTQLISHNSPSLNSPSLNLHSTSLTQLISTHLTQLILRNSSCTTHLTPFISHNSPHTTPLTQLISLHSNLSTDLI